MAEIIIMPKLGFNMDEGRLVKWAVAVGAPVKKGDVLFEIETDKTTMPVEATSDGVLLKTMLEEGNYADVFTPIAVVGAAGENPDAALAACESGAPAPAPEAAATAPAPAPAPASSAPGGSGAYDYDVVVIGGGPGGYVAAIKAAQKGLSTCLIESTYLGGTCLNVGCIPTKTLIKTANTLSLVKESAAFAIEGVDPARVSVSMPKLQERKKAVVGQLVGGVKGLLRGNKVTVIDGLAAFEDSHSVVVNGETVTAENFIVATGSVPLIPSFIPLEGNTNVITSTEALDLDNVPASVAVIGGGVIGIEFAYLLNKLGSKVTVLELLDHILPMVDEEVSGMAKKRLEKDGVTLNLGAKVQKVKDNKVIFELDGKEQSVEADVVLMAVGRAPNTEGLCADKAGIEFDRSAIAAGPCLRTNVRNIFAIGDVNAKVMLAHTASHEGIIAVENILGGDKKMDYAKIPSCIYLEPEIAAIGLTEKQAKEQRGDIKVGKFPMAANGKSLVEGDTDGIVKVILDAELGEILGVHMMGPHVTEMITEVAAAMTLEATAEEIIATIHPHPTVSESVAEGFMAAADRAIHSM